ncbi:PREDICTED: protein VERNALIZATION INSENSITIVE 3-like [Camelina sativa]|uniref:Protein VERNALIZATION INSENSITIVE 3-like n=1 Tax=Camelina sativa TaxID=90675 RepID=A0ABM1R9H0_CAMSA|nr:PREDICTED: protein VERNALIZATION INSENSITIVE 3-like [Camelina sativa]
MKIICAEMGKERKYTGLAKPKLIENLLNLVSRPLGETSCSDRRNSRKKQKKTIGYIICCENLACRAALGSDDTFCRRCSCCICQKFDDNKDPSLWLTCVACGLSCHLECGLKQDRYGIGIGSDDLDGRFYCSYCGKDNDLLGCWRKQVKVAKETRRVDVLCYRLSLGQKLLKERLRKDTTLPSALALCPASDFTRRTQRFFSLSPLRVSFPFSPSSSAISIVSSIKP